MGRIILQELDNYRFMHTQRTCIANMNMAGHVGAPQMAELVHDGRFKMLKSIGLNEMNLGDGATGIIIGDMTINFKSEIFIDEEIVIETDVAAVEEKSFRIYHRITKNGKVAALAETGHVTFNYRERKICTVPEIFINKLKEL